MTGLRDPDGVVHVASGKEKYQSAPYRETLCEFLAGRVVFWAGPSLQPTNDAPTCFWCVRD